MGLGDRIRKRRKSMDMTQAQLAEAIGRTAGYISQVERAHTAPSLTGLRLIARALNVPVAYFFEPSPDIPTNTEPLGTIDTTRNQARAKVVRSDMRKRLIDPRGKDIQWELLSPDLRGRLEVLLVTYQPGAAIDTAMGHEGEECGLVLQGCLEANVAGEIHTLHEGDSICFRSDQPHAFRNLSDGPTVAIWVVTPPSF